LTGGTGRRNLLIAGGSASVLIGADDDDLLIGGTTDYDTDVTALLAIMSEWTRTDEDYATRVGNLTSGTGAPLLDGTTVHGNGGGHLFLGGGGVNLYYGDLQPDAYDRDPGAPTVAPLHYTPSAPRAAPPRPPAPPPPGRP